MFDNNLRKFIVHSNDIIIS